MKIKPSKSRTISIVKGRLVDRKFSVDGEPNPTVLDALV